MLTLLFYTGLQLFLQRCYSLLHPFWLAPTCTQTRNYGRDVGTQNLGPQCTFPNCPRLSQVPSRKSSSRRGITREVNGSWGIGRVPPGSPPGIAALMGGTDVPSLFRVTPFPTALMGRACPGRFWLSPALSKPLTYLFRDLICRTLLCKGFSPATASLRVDFAELLVGIFSSTKERSTLNFKTRAACIFCPSDLSLARSEINQGNI